MVRPVEWKSGKIRFLDQTRLPTEEWYVETDNPEEIADAIKRLAIRGAPLIGIASAYGIALAAARMVASPLTNPASALDESLRLFSSTRPTAVNLFWALKRQRQVVERFSDQPVEAMSRALLAEAQKIHAEDQFMCSRIGELGAELLQPGSAVLTHCNTGSLATGGSGTAQSVISASWEQGRLKHVYIDETRPLFQGARLTAWELGKLGIPFTVNTDSTAAYIMQKGLVNAVITGADRIAANGDVANKVGTYNLAVLAKYHSLPLYVAAPTSSIDFELEHGKDIPIEQRGQSEILEVNGKRLAPTGTEAFSPAFDVTPNELISAIITEHGILRPPYHAAMDSLRKNIVDVKSEIV